MTEAKEEAVRADLFVAQDGRVTIPAQVRHVVGIEPGSSLVCYLEKGRVVLEERRHLLARVQDEVLAAEAAAGRTDSAVDELIAERRAEAAREDGVDGSNTGPTA